MKEDMESVMNFIQQNRSNEVNFEKLYRKLEEEIGSNKRGNEYKESLNEVKEKLSKTYRKAKETSGSAWPEFEKFVTGFETAVADAVKRPG